MKDQAYETTQASVSGALAGKAVATPPLQSALNENGEQVEKLGALIADLDARLKLVRRDTDAEKEPGEPAQNTPEVASSPALRQLRDQIQMVKNLQRRVQKIIREIEV